MRQFGASHIIITVYFMLHGVIALFGPVAFKPVAKRSITACAVSSSLLAPPVLYLSGYGSTCLQVVSTVREDESQGSQARGALLDPWFELPLRLGAWGYCLSCQPSALRQLCWRRKTSAYIQLI
jgi:hypothetical protein